MKIALSTDAEDLDGSLNPTFGRSRRFLIYDNLTGKHQWLANPGFGAASGAGVQAAHLLVEQGVNQVVSGQFGLKARPILEQAGIRVIENRRGSLKTLLGLAPAMPVKARTYPVDSRRSSAGGYCACEACGWRTDDDEGLPCFKQRCPNCGAMLERRFG